DELGLRIAEDAARALVDLLDVLESPRRPERLGHQSQRFKRKNASIEQSTAAMIPNTTQKAHAVSKPRKRTFMPKTPVISVRGSRTTEKIVSTRRMSFWRCEITDSFVSSSASTTSL